MNPSQMNLTTILEPWLDQEIKYLRWTLENPPILANYSPQATCGSERKSFLSKKSRPSSN